MPFADFDKVTFTGASAKTSTGSVGPSLANLIDIKQSGIRLTESSVGLTTVTVEYV